MQHLERARDLLEALAGQDVGRILSFFAPDARFEFPGALEMAGLDQIHGFNETVRHNMAAIGVQGFEFRPLRNASSGNTTFAEWECVSHRNTGPVVFRGVIILSWDAAGLVEHAWVYTDPDAVRRVAVGMAARLGPTEAALN